MGDRGSPGPASWLANLLGSGVLPVLYGFLGAIAAVVRTLSRKIKGSLLSPRDVQLTFQQLALGAVVGACISLFIAAPGASDSNTSLLGPVGLSSSAVAFVAGFGVDSVFKALEALISRIFKDLARPEQPPDPKPDPAADCLLAPGLDLRLCEFDTRRHSGRARHAARSEPVRIVRAVRVGQAVLEEAVVVFDVDMVHLQPDARARGSRRSAPGSGRASRRCRCRCRACRRSRPRSSRSPP